MNLALARLHLRIDCRRPASWLALALAAAGTAWLLIWPPAETGVQVAAAIAFGGLAAVTAIGDPPRGLYGPAAGWIWLRAAWPLGAVIVAGLACGLGLGSLAVPALASVSIVATAWGMVAAVRVGAMPGDAVSLSLATAAVAAAASLCAVKSGGDEFGASVAAGAVWLAAHAAWRAWETGRSDVAMSLAPAGPVGLLPCGPEGRLLFGIAMLTALAGMVGWLFLARDAAGWYRLLAAAWFVVGAVPQATLAEGAADDGPRSRLLAMRPDSRESARLPLWTALHRRVDAWRPAAAWAAVLGWPLLVAAVLSPTAAERLDRVATLGGLMAAVGGLTAVTAALRLAAATRETALAAAMILAACSGMMLRESGHSCETSCSWQGSPFVRGVVSCKEVHPPVRAVGVAWSPGPGS
jgi:hypothetical protein